MRAALIIGTGLILNATHVLSSNSTFSTDPFAPGDGAYRERNQEGRAREALNWYRVYYLENSQNSNAAWRLSMACHYVGMRFTQNNDGKIKLFTEGRDVALATLKQDSRCIPCHFWAAINMALLGEAAGIFKMLFTLGEVQEHLTATLSGDPSYAYGGAYRILGLIEQRLPGILGGSNDRARNYMEKAIESAQTEPLNYLFLAKLLLEEFDDKAQAIEVIKKGLTVPMPTSERVESLEALLELKELAVTVLAPSS